VLQDTAGVRESADEIERIGIARTRRHADEADLIIAIFDGSRPFEDEDRDVIRMCRERVGVALLSKSDLPQLLSPEMLDEYGLEMPLLAFSALKAQGVSELRDRLERAVEALLGKRGENGPEGVAISRERHRDALAHAVDALESARLSALSSMPPEIVAVDVGLAAEALASITGAVTTEDVLDAVFREFCIGK
jgi:tRNA modification GTPase